MPAMMWSSVDLPRAGRPHKREIFPRRNVERDVVESGDVDFALLINLQQVSDGDDVAVRRQKAAFKSAASRHDR